MNLLKRLFKHCPPAPLVKSDNEYYNILKKETVEYNEVTMQTGWVDLGYGRN